MINNIIMIICIATTILTSMIAPPMIVLAIQDYKDKKCVPYKKSVVLVSTVFVIAACLSLIGAFKYDNSLDNAINKNYQIYLNVTPTYQVRLNSNNVERKTLNTYYCEVDNDNQKIFLTPKK